MSNEWEEIKKFILKYKGVYRQSKCSCRVAKLKNHRRRREFCGRTLFIEMAAAKED